MATQLKWSNKARTRLLPTDGAFSDGDARWCGYEDLAAHIATNPKAFTKVDQQKARNILLNLGRIRLANQIPND